MTKDRGYTIFPATWKARLLLAVGLVAGLLLVVGNVVWVFRADPGPLAFFNAWDKVEVTYENRTDTTIFIYTDDRLEVTVPSRSSVSVSDRKIYWWFSRRIEARDVSGRIIFATKKDEDDLKDIGYRIVIEGP